MTREAIDDEPVGPFLGAAFFCQAVEQLGEDEGDVLTIHQVADRLVLGPGQDGVVTLFVRLYSGGGSGGGLSAGACMEQTRRG